MYVASFLLVGTAQLPASLALIDLLALSGLCGFQVLQTHSCHSNLNTMLLLLLHLFYKLPLSFLSYVSGEWEWKIAFQSTLELKSLGNCIWQMLKPQLPSTCSTFLPGTSNNGNVVVLMKDFYRGPLNMVQIAIVRHKPFRFLGIALPFNSSQAFVFFKMTKMYLF